MSQSMASPSLEDLNETVRESWNTSPTSSTASSETIKPSSSKIKMDTIFPLKGNFMDKTSLIDNITSDSTSLLDVKDNWKEVIKSDLKESINYVEKHLPSSEIDDTSYITSLLEDINRKSINYLKDLNDHVGKINPSKLIYHKEIGANVDKWIEEMRKEISKYE